MDAAQKDAQGITPTERLLFKSCRSTFLQLWSYANVFRDQGKRGGGDGKELCDVMVVFGDTVILFSDKSCQFPDSGKLEVDWARWYRRAIEASQRQLMGAERWLRTNPERVFMDRRCTQPLHVSLPTPDKMRVYKIVVALGAAERCRQHFGSGTGSLTLLAANETELSTSTRPKPFTVWLMERDDHIFHVTDDVSLPVLLQELDTISDFVEYLEMKERMIRDRRLVAVAGEEDLVGIFIGARAALPEFLMSFRGARLLVAEGIYSDVLARPDYRAYVRANRSSYFWDYLIANHCLCTLAGTLVPGSVRGVGANESMLRVLAAEPRVRRRILGDSYLSLISFAPDGEVTSRTMIGESGTVYVFQVHARMEREYSEYRRQRQEYLQRYCFLTGWRNREKRRVVGFVTDRVPPMMDGYDIALLEFEQWTPEMIETGARVNKEISADGSRPLTRREINPKHVTAWGSPAATPKRRAGKRRSKRKWRRG